jgi:Mg-chelatase subunit ChlD
MDAVLEGIRQDMAALRPDDRAGLIVFGASPVLILPLTEVRRIAASLRFRLQPPRADATGIAAAIRAAARQLADEADERQLVLLSDGRETAGDARAEAAMAADAGLRVFALPVGPAALADARVSLLRGPTSVQRGTPFHLVVEVVATADIQADLIVHRAGSPLAERHLALEAGVPRRLVLPDRLEAPGPHTYTARLAVADACPVNNEARAVLRVEGPTRVLYLAPAPDAPLARVLARADGLSVASLDPSRAPIEARLLDAADCVVLDGVPATGLPRPFQDAVRDWVRDTAGGLVALGSLASYGPGGFAGSPVEEALPVLCSRPKSMALVVAIDKSGSMAERSPDRPKIAFAREAVLRAARELREEDRFALLAFDARSELLLPLGPAPGAERLEQVLDAIRPHGPTELGLALEHALRLAAESPARVRHVVLVSDGQTTDLDATALRRQFVGAGVSLSVLMTGRDAQAIQRLRDLAGAGFYRVTDPSRLWAAFLVALRKVAYEGFVRQGEFAVRPAAPLAVAEGVALAGALRGYIRTAAKPTATTEWHTGEPPDPILARWQFGLGRAVAFASTFGTEWDAPVWGEGAASRLGQQAVRWAARPPATPGFEAEVTERTDAFVLSVRAERGGRFLNGLDLAVRAATPDGEALDLPLPQTAPGEYQADVPTPARGIYHLTVVERGRGPRLAVSVAKNYTSEWEGFGPDRPVLEAIARHGRGEVIDALGALEIATPRRAAAYADLDWAAAAAALVFFVADVFLYVLRSRRVRL